MGIVISIMVVLDAETAAKKAAAAAAAAKAKAATPPPDAPYLNQNIYVQPLPQEVNKCR